MSHGAREWVIPLVVAAVLMAGAFLLLPKLVAAIVCAAIILSAGGWGLLRLKQKRRL